MINKQQKISLVEGLSKDLEAAKGLVLVNFAGMGVKTQQDLKKRLKEAGATFVVVKNTLLKKAAEAAKIDVKVIEGSILTGQTALVIAGEDSLAPVQIIGKFAKEFTVPKMKVGIVEGLFQDKDALEMLSKLPNRDVLLSQVLGSLMGNLYGLVATLKGPGQKLVYVLNQKVGDYK
ncbi:MAG: 50S ribosomal protein L10 [Patescibacteria group bacterium]